MAKDDQGKEGETGIYYKIINVLMTQGISSGKILPGKMMGNKKKKNEINARMCGINPLFLS